MKNRNDPVRNRSRNLSACSAVTELTIVDRYGRAV